MIVYDTDDVYRLPLAINICGFAANSGGAVYVPNAASDSRFNEQVDCLPGLKRKGEHVRDIFAVPLKRPDTMQVIGVVSVCPIL